MIEESKLVQRTTQVYMLYFISNNLFYIERQKQNEFYASSSSNMTRMVKTNLNLFRC